MPLGVIGLRHSVDGGSSHTVAAEAGDRLQPRFVASTDHGRDLVSPSPRQALWKRVFAEIEESGNEERREEMWADFVARIPVADVPATLEELQHLGYGESELFQRLVRRWAQAEGHAAAAWAERLPDGLQRDHTLSSLAIEWANADLSSAAAWAGQLPAPAEQQALLITISGEAVRTDPVEALRLAASLPAAAARDEVIRRAAAEWALQDAASAVAWAKQIPDEPLRSQVLAGTITASAEFAPELAATLAVQSLPSGRLLDDTVISVVQRWAQQQPMAAAAWVGLFPEGELRETAFAILANPL